VSGRRGLKAELEAGPAGGARPLAFVVDDDGVTRQLMARLLRSWGCDVSQFRDGRALVDTMASLIAEATPTAAKTAATLSTKSLRAVASGGSEPGMLSSTSGSTPGGFAQRWPDVLCLDSSMPGLDGPDAWLRVRADAAEAGVLPRVAAVRVVGVTGHADDTERSRFRAAGAATLLSKPVDPERLRVVICGSSTA